MSDRDKQARFVAMRRRTGMARDRRETLNAAVNAKSDWRADCRGCGAHLRGTVEELLQHECPRSG